MRGRRARGFGRACAVTPLERVRSALGKRWGQLLHEDPRREAWARLPADTLERAFRDAQRQAATGRAERSFATLLIEHLDFKCGIGSEPPAVAEAGHGEVMDASGRVHRPDHDHAARERARRAREARAEEAYADAYGSALDAGEGDAEAHQLASQARARVLAGSEEA